jgi:hypothetical protein
MDHLLSREQSHPIGAIQTVVTVQGAVFITHFTNCIALIIELVPPPIRSYGGPMGSEDMMSTRWMPWRCVPMKDGAPLRYAAGSR